ncbi:MAG: hypothetical protein E7532_08505 [Ruminococcaceae bacterium]|nr:hypothetical protein [Oscillospiraceae bacterium]
MKDTMYNKYYEKLISMVMMMNNHAKEKDLLRNHTNYGSVSTLSQILRDMGHEVDACVYGDGDYLISAKIIVDGETKINFED